MVNANGGTKENVCLAKEMGRNTRNNNKARGITRERESEREIERERDTHIDTQRLHASKITITKTGMSLATSCSILFEMECEPY